MLMLIDAIEFIWVKFLLFITNNWQCH